MRSRVLPVLLCLAYAAFALAMVYFMSHRAKPIGHAAIASGLLFVFCALAFVARRPPAAPTATTPSLDATLLAAIAALVATATAQVGVDIWTDPIAKPFVRIALWSAIVLMVPYLLLVVPRGATSRFASRYPFRAIVFLLLGLFLAAKLAPITLKPDPPGIDVWYVLTRGAQNFMNGDNPFSTRIPEAIRLGLEFGNPPGTYVYPPAALYLTLPFVRFTTDVRFIYPLADLCTALLILGFARPLGGSARLNRLCEIAALAVTVHPMGFGYVWTDLLHAPLFCFFVWLALRGWLRVAPGVLGYLLAMKQYMVFFAAPALTLLRTRRAFVIAACVGLATVVPFLVWDARAMWSSLVTFHLNTPFRRDGITASAILHAYDHAPLAPWLGPAIAGPLVALGTWWFWRRGLVGVCVLTSAALACLFFFSQYAFSNYYHFVTVLMLVGALVAVAESEGWSFVGEARDAAR